MGCVGSPYDIRYVSPGAVFHDGLIRSPRRFTLVSWIDDPGLCLAVLAVLFCWFSWEWIGLFDD